METVKNRLAYRVEVALLESERHLDHIRYFELKSDIPDIRHIAFAKCMRIEIYITQMKSIARQ